MRRLWLPPALLLLMTACGRENGGRTMIRLSGWSSSPEETQLLETQLAEFESLHPDIRVKYEPVVGDYMQKIQVLFASNTEPDVFYLDSNSAPRMIHYGVLEPLDGYLEQAGDDRDDFYENILASFRGPGRTIYGLPKGFSTLALYYNKEHFEKAGIPEPPKDWSGLMLAAEKLRARDIVPFCLTTDLKTIHLFAGLAGGRIVRDDQILAFRDPTGRAGIRTLIDLLGGEHPAARTPQESGKAWTGDAFAKGDAAMIFEGMWVAPFLALSAPDMRYGFAPVPAMAARHNIIFTVAYAASRRSRHKREAVELIRYLTGRKGLAHVSRLGLEIPSRKSVVEAGFLRRFPERRTFIDAVEYAVPFRYGLEFNRLEENVVKAVEAARLEQMTLEAALDRAAEKLKRFYDTGAER